MNRLFSASKWYHKYFGLALALFLIWMSFSGILLNHPDWINRIDTPPFLTPPQYHFNNWNRGSANSFVISQNDSSLSFIGGKTGIWVSRNNFKNYTLFDENLSLSSLYRKTNSLILIEDFGKKILLAGMDCGLFGYDLNTGQWHNFNLKSSRKKIVKIIRYQNRCYVFSESELFISEISDADLQFNEAELKRWNSASRISLVRYFFDLHSGEFLHLTGKLFYDIMGLFIIFLSFTAIIIWLFPKYRNFLKIKNRNRIFKLSFKYHLKFGIFVAFFLLLIGATGFFLRPPPLAFLANKFVSSSYYPGIYPQNPWHRKIQNAAILAEQDKIMIAAEDGIWSAPLDLTEPFKKENIILPVFIMGATIFEETDPNILLTGSFNGLYRYDFKNQICTNYFNGRIISNHQSNVVPADTMITGFFALPDGRNFVFSHRQGLLNSVDTLFIPDQASVKSIRMPFWNFLFELHNGRIFKDLIGGFYILLLPLGSLFFFLITFTGIYDWIYLKFIRFRKRR